MCMMMNLKTISLLNNSTLITQLTKKILRYILYKIESQLNGGADYDFESDKGTIEHILPESYSEPYKVLFSEEEFHKNIFFY